jgi:hypothetical protein
MRMNRPAGTAKMAEKRRSGRIGTNRAGSRLHPARKADGRITRLATRHRFANHRDHGICIRVRAWKLNGRVARTSAPHIIQPSEAGGGWKDDIRATRTGPRHHAPNISSELNQRRAPGVSRMPRFNGRISHRKRRYPRLTNPKTESPALSKI